MEESPALAITAAASVETVNFSRPAFVLSRTTASYFLSTFVKVSFTGNVTSVSASAMVFLIKSFIVCFKLSMLSTFAIRTDIGYAASHAYALFTLSIVVKSTLLNKCLTTFIAIAAVAS